MPALTNPVQDRDVGPDPGSQTAVVTWDLPTSTLPGEQPGVVTCTPESGSTFQPGKTPAMCETTFEMPVSGIVVTAVNKFEVRVCELMVFNFIYKF